MEVLAKAQAMERAGERVVHLEIGEPDFETPGPAVEEAVKAIREGHTRYTDSMGLAELRGAIATNLRGLCGVDIDPGAEIAVTSGVSGGLFLALASVLDPGDEVVLADPTYPCYQNFIRFLDGAPRMVPLVEEGFGLDIDRLQEALTPKSRAILLNSPSNPTGMLLEKKELRAITEITGERGIYVLVDEIYSSLVYDRKRAPSILETGYEGAIMLDGFSKLYAMTGWRLGYMAAGAEVIEAVRRLQQNFYICPSSIAQKAAIAALQCRREAEAMVREFDRRRRFVAERLRGMGGLRVREPLGAYYVFPDVSAISRDSFALASRLLEEAKVAVVPGRAFGEMGEGHLRFSYAASIEALEEGLDRVEKAIAGWSSGPSRTPPL
ncbi:MAG: pyridoxal phosphate-dependent aminotransferase [Euryarchaeota archaeon]|nr:pyridoxal phosphate-dependent aminotransferase [Euryarchaeota archaeon]